jgi:hypothetical protein
VPGPAWVGDPPYQNDDVYGNSAVQQPTMHCGLDNGLVVNPTWSQDSGSVAYGSSDGIHVMSVPADFNCNATADRLLVAGGKEPDWGPADVDLSQKPSPPATGVGTGQGLKKPVAGLALRKLKLTPTAFRARAGAKLRFSLGGPAKLTLTVRRASGKAVKGAIKTAGKPGLNTLRFKGRIGGKTLRPGRYRLTITARAMVGGATAKATMAFRIVR